MKLNIHFGIGHNKELSNLYKRPFTMKIKYGEKIKYESTKKKAN